jgi:predicted pyridoxine 5'-phosphate oxidase superfamily flavin-nucleotide-binding protein
MDHRTPGSSGAPVSTGECALQEHFGTRELAQKFYDRQVLDHLNEPMRRFVDRQEMMFLATSDAHGACDNTLRAGPPGFIRILDEHRLTWPEYRGNGVMASLGNITENPHVGLLFVDFVEDVIGLHVNATAEIMEDPMIRSNCPDLPVDPAPGRRAQVWVVARVDEAYIHCAKHIPRLRKVPCQRGEHTDAPQPKKSDYFVTGATARRTVPGA